jgi:uncharacterized damage-inducible protein DinB
MYKKGIDMDTTLTTLYRHNLWANQELFALCATLPDEQLDATIIGTFGTIRETLTHIATAERGYLSRIRTGLRYTEPEGTPPLSLAEIVALISQTGQAMIEAVPTITPDATVEINWDGEMRMVPKTVIAAQVINHATEHRAQIMAILTQLGIEPPELDAWMYHEMRSR